LRDICTGSIDLLFKVHDESITSLRWSGEGSRIAVGTTDNAVSIWDLDTKKKLRIMNGHSARVGSLAWNNHILSSGSRDTMIFHHDVRIRDHIQQSLSAHKGEICGLEWSSDGQQLASGGNDNKCYVWDASSSIPKHTFGDSVAAVRALAWCPFRKDLLATGSGQSDKHIRFYDSCSGRMLRSVDTGSQVSSLIWGQHGEELVSSHGYSQNQLSVWQYPSLKKITDLTGHTSRILHMTPSSDGTTVCSAGADETLRFWKIWELQKSKKKAKVSLRTCKNIR
jgi:cell division cycle protein 20 (cofactor of APC complex)